MRLVVLVGFAFRGERVDSTLARMSEDRGADRQKFSCSERPALDPVLLSLSPFASRKGCTSYSEVFLFAALVVLSCVAAYQVHGTNTRYYLFSGLIFQDKEAGPVARAAAVLVFFD